MAADPGGVVACPEKAGVMMEDKRLNEALRWAIKAVMMIGVYALLFLFVAGDWRWSGGWWFIALNALSMALTGGLLLFDRPGMVDKRSRIGEGTPGWDRILAPVMALGSMSIGLIASVGHRFGAGWAVPLWLRVGSFVIAGAGSFLTVLAMRQNRFFESTVRIQQDDGHRVISTGLYRWVRHPGYLFTFVFNLFSPLVLGSWWAFIGVGLNLVVTVWRTAREDRFLRENLEGYAAYAERTRWRLFPGVW